MSSRKPIVFLSHSAKDGQTLSHFKKALERATGGTITFFLSSDGQSIKVGYNWVASLQESLEKAALAFVFLTTNSLNSTWVAFEAGFMHSKKIRVIPVALPGVDMGSVPPPLSLLQGFHLHSAELMNNVFTYLNEEFQHHHERSFTDSDYQSIFGAQSAFSTGFFGDYSSLVTQIVVTGTSSGRIIEGLARTLAQHKIELTKQSDRDVKRGSAPGLVAWQNHNSEFRIEIDSAMCSLLLSSVLAITSKRCSNRQITVGFVLGVKRSVAPNGMSARAFGTEIKILSSGLMSFRGIETKMDDDTALSLRATARADADGIRDIVMLLFGRGMLAFRPESTSRGAGSIRGL